MNLVIAPRVVKAFSWSPPTNSVSSTSRKTSHKSTTTTKSASITSKKTSHSPPSTSSSRTEVAPKPVFTRSKASFLTSTPLATTESFSPTPTPTDSSQRPLELWPVVCEDEANLPGHAPINPEHQRMLSGIICHDIVSKHDITSMDSQSEASTYNINPDGTNYFYSISWVDGCKTIVDRQDDSAPVGNSGLHCLDLFTRAYTECNNGSVGGYIDAGCMRYQFIGGQ